MSPGSVLILPEKVVFDDGRPNGLLADIGRHLGPVLQRHVDAHREVNRIIFQNNGIILF